MKKIVALMLVLCMMLAAIPVFAESAEEQAPAASGLGDLLSGLLGDLGDEIQLVKFLHDDEDTLAHLLGEQGQFDIALVLVAIADDDRITLALDGDNGVELGL